MANNNFSSSPNFSLVNPYRNGTNSLNKKYFKQQHSVVSMGCKSVMDYALIATNTRKVTNAAILSSRCMELDKVGETKEGWADDHKIGDWADDCDDTFYYEWCSWLVEMLQPIVASAETPTYISVPAKTVLFFVKLCVGKHKKETKKIFLDQLVGLEAPRAEMKEILQRLQDSCESHVLTPTGVLLWGSSGTGKTTLSHALAREAEASFLPIAGEDLLRDEKGVGKLNIIFSEARDSARSIIFIDGLEAVKAVKKLIGQMDKCVSDGAVVLVVATAEKLHLMDEKLMDYMSTMIELKKPNLQTRQDMANVIIQKQETEVPEGEKETVMKYIASEMDGCWCPHDLEDKRIKKEAWSDRWKDIMEDLITPPCNNNIMSIVKKLVLAACVYYIWNERNRRLFRDEKKSYKEVLKEIINNIRFKMACFSVKGSSMVNGVYNQWQVPMNIKKSNETVIGKWIEK
ncbi:ATP-dependent metalloprotease FtsH [Artemisia annua]|uniref:ATP-dependent metalloprotease FtsH n=1 Tax=Artemisia annua TaxID=35608 RepID=A0A2U1P626_ARTAN|nr:ATP-dependent metalloprotease FtsH [Artemisia annua]